MGPSRTLTNTLVQGNGGNDTFNLVSISNTIINTNADDDNISINGEIHSSEIYAGRQKDIIVISGNVDSSLIRSDANDDTITVNGNITNTIINGNADNDRLTINSNNVLSSTVYGGKGSDDIDINSDAIYVSGGKGSDDIDIASSKKHTIFGNGGDDTIDSNSTEPLFVDGGEDRDTINITSAAAEEAAHTLDGGAGNDNLNGTSGREKLDGGTEDNGNDTLISNGGNDTLYGRAGNDLINLQAGVNDGTVLVHAGAGEDLIEVSIDELTHEDVIKGDKGIDTLAIVGNADDFDMWVPNTIPSRAFDAISNVEVLAFGSSETSYTISGTKTINLGSKVQSAGILTIDATNASGGNDDALVVNAFQFSSRTNLTFIGSDDKM